MSYQTTRCSSHILVAEDNPMIRKLYDRILGNIYKKSFFHDGQAAWEYLSNGAVKPDLLITDINMPRMDGHELIKLVNGKGIPIIATSGDPEEIDAVLQANHSSVRGVLHKPFNVVQLHIIVKKALQPLDNPAQRS